MSEQNISAGAPGHGPTSAIGTARVKRGMAEMLKGGVIMDVVTAEQAKIAEDAGAVAVMALERVPADIRSQGGRRVPVSSARVFRLRLGCPKTAATSCWGTVTPVSGSHQAAHARFGPIAPGKSKRLVTRLTTRFRQRLKRDHTLSLSARVLTRKPAKRTTRVHLKLLG